MSDPLEKYRKVLPDNDHLKLFLQSFKTFENSFCEFMNTGEDFTLRLEVRGNKKGLVHCRVSTDDLHRPSKQET